MYRFKKRLFVILIIFLIISLPVSFAKGIDISKIKTNEEFENGRPFNLIIRYVPGGTGTAAKINDQGEVSYMHRDRIRSNRITTNSAGVIDKRFKALPFGQGLINEGIKHSFAGEKELDESKLYYFGARYYDPVMGRFTSLDPLFASQAYTYVTNNPLNSLDAYGQAGEGVQNFNEGLATCVGCIGTGIDIVEGGVVLVSGGGYAPVYLAGFAGSYLAADWIAAKFQWMVDATGVDPDYAQTGMLIFGGAVAIFTSGQVVRSLRKIKLRPSVSRDSPLKNAFANNPPGPGTLNLRTHMQDLNGFLKQGDFGMASKSLRSVYNAAVNRGVKTKLGLKFVDEKVWSKNAMGKTSSKITNMEQGYLRISEVGGTKVEIKLDMDAFEYLRANGVKSYSSQDFIKTYPSAAKTISAEMVGPDTIPKTFTRYGEELGTLERVRYDSSMGP